MDRIDYVHEMLAMERRAYEARIKPWLDELARIEALRPTVRATIPVEQLPHLVWCRSCGTGVLSSYTVCPVCKGTPQLAFPAT